MEPAAAQYARATESLEEMRVQRSLHNTRSEYCGIIPVFIVNLTLQERLFHGLPFAQVFPE